LSPRAAFFVDLAQVIQDWHHQGDEVLLFADFNGDIRHQEVSLFALSCGLHECVLSRHPTLPPPATFKHGDRFGRSPIDGVWATEAVSICAASMLPVNMSPGNHRAFLLDLHLCDTIGEPWFRVARPPCII